MPLLDDDRLFPADERTRGLARALYGSIRDLPIVSPHGHTDPAWFALNEPFPDPARLFVVPDHYVFRMLCSQGISLTDLGVPRVDGGDTEQDPRRIWRLFAGNFHLFRGTPSAMWINHAFQDVFGIDEPLSAATGRCQLRPHRRLPRPPRVPPARAVRTVQHRGYRHHGAGSRSARPSSRHPRWRLGRPGRHRLSSRCRHRSAVRGVCRQCRPSRRTDRRGCDRLDRLSRRAPDAARVLQGPRRHLDRSRRAERTHREPVADGRRRAFRQGTCRSLRRGGSRPASALTC